MKLILFGIFCILSLAEADIIDTRTIEVSGEITCCPGINTLKQKRDIMDDVVDDFKKSRCSAPTKAKIELWDHFKG
uniref:Uncharacterized protein n=1 Tax=Panagrolaimus davidi TaxID=227884 RepID=A0A914Q5P9_9BILA